MAPCPPLNTPLVVISRSIRCCLIAFLLLISYVTVWLWPLTLNICSVSAGRCSNSVPNLSEIEQSAAELLRFQYDIEQLSHVALHSEVVCTMSELSHLHVPDLLALFLADTLCYVVTLTLTPWLWTRVVDRVPCVLTLYQTSIHQSTAIDDLLTLKQRFFVNFCGFSIPTHTKPRLFWQYDPLSAILGLSGSWFQNSLA